MWKHGKGNDTRSAGIRQGTGKRYFASAKTESSREKNAAELGIRLTADNKSVAEFADILFLAVKPQYYEEVIAEIKDTVSDDEIIVSIAPGKSLSWFDEMFGKSLKVIRTMPNTPAMVGEGMRESVQMKEYCRRSLIQCLICARAFQRLR